MNYIKSNIYALSRKSHLFYNFQFNSNHNLFISRNYLTICPHKFSKVSQVKYVYSKCNYVAFHSKTHKIFPICTPAVRIIFYRTFKTSQPRKIHPIFWYIAKPILKLAAVLSGRGFRKWWRDLPKDKKTYFINVIRANARKLIVAAIISASLFASYYYSHLENTPITDRQRFMAFSHKQLEKLNEFELQQVTESLKPHIVPSSHPVVKRVEYIVQRILSANQDIKEVHDKQWGVSVIDNSIENAFVLPIGHVFVFTGMLKLCSNDDQLGTILAHEIAHCLQNHGAENVSFSHLLDLVSIIVITAIWAFLPSDVISFLTHWLYQEFIQISFTLPYNRNIETEADQVGLHLAAKACFDVRESSAFWSKMALLHSTFGKDSQIEFLSTHPSHESRSQYLDSIMDEAIKTRRDCGCAKLSFKDPRLDVEAISRALEQTRKQYLELHPKPIIIIKS